MNKKIDTRKLPFEAIEEKRRIAKELRKTGMTRAEIGQIVGVHADTVGKWLKIDDKELALKKRGPKLGDNRLLSDDQKARIKKLLIDKTPDQLKLNYAFWTRKSVRDLIL